MTPHSAPAPLNYDLAAAMYARHRGIHPGVIHELIQGGPIDAETRVLDIGCGTGNYARALAMETRCHVSGIEPSAGMLERARAATAWDALVQGQAEALPFSNASFDLVMSTDVIHHLGDRSAYFREAARVLQPDGKIVTVTDSHEDIVRRRPLSSHFPETVPIEHDRYPGVPRLLAELEEAGFSELRVVEVAQAYELTDARAYRDRAFSSLLLIDDAAHRRGVTRLEQDLARGPIPCVSLYTIIWGVVP